MTAGTRPSRSRGLAAGESRVTSGRLRHPYCASTILLPPFLERTQLRFQRRDTCLGRQPSLLLAPGAFLRGIPRPLRRLPSPLGSDLRRPLLVRDAQGHPGRRVDHPQSAVHDPEDQASDRAGDALLRTHGLCDQPPPHPMVRLEGRLQQRDRVEDVVLIIRAWLSSVSAIGSSSASGKVE